MYSTQAYLYPAIQFSFGFYTFLSANFQNMKMDNLS